MLTLKMLTEADFQTTNWSGGKTTELYISPENSSYSERNFDFRISRAVVEAEASVFTKLPGVTRYLSILEGALTLQINEDLTLALNPYEICQFQGDWDVKSFGKAMDFNLMIQKGIGQLITRRLIQCLQLPCAAGRHFFYCHTQDLAFTFNEEVVDLPKGCLLYLDTDTEVSVTIQSEWEEEVCFFEIGVGLEVLDLF